MASIWSKLSLSLKAMPIIQLEMSTSTAKSIAVQTGKALTYMHSRNPRVIHHDIKPSDIMVRGYVKT